MTSRYARITELEARLLERALEKRRTEAPIGPDTLPMLAAWAAGIVVALAFSLAAGSYDRPPVSLAAVFLVVAGPLLAAPRYRLLPDTLRGAFYAAGCGLLGAAPLLAPGLGPAFAALALAALAATAWLWRMPTPQLVLGAGWALGACGLATTLQGPAALLALLVGVGIPPLALARAWQHRPPWRTGALAAGGAWGLVWLVVVALRAADGAVADVVLLVAAWTGLLLVGGYLLAAHGQDGPAAAVH